MTTGERLVDISTLTSDTALQHFLNISVGGGDTYITREPLIGEAQKIELLTGNIQYISTLEGTIKKPVILQGEVTKISLLEGGLKEQGTIKGNIKCQ